MQVIGDRPDVADVAPAAAPTAAQVRGFDRLLVAGLSEEQVEALRMTYYDEIRELDAVLPRVEGTFRALGRQEGAAPPQERARAGEDGVQRLRRVEELWMAQQGAHSEFGACTACVGSAIW